MPAPRTFTSTTFDAQVFGVNMDAFVLCSPSLM
jgi:hypothetical protein